MNTIRRFLFNDLNIRGVIVQSGSEWQSLLRKREYPQEIAHRLGEASAIVLLMSSHFKSKQKLTLQLQSQGDLKILVAQAYANNYFRAMANFDLGNGKLLDMIDENAVMVMSIESPLGKPPYQGITSITHNKLSYDIEDYFNQSEQLQTQLYTKSSNQGFVGILIQALPEKNTNQDHWQRLKMMNETLSVSEALEKNSETLIRQLYAEDDVIIYDEEKIKFSCLCSSEKTQSILHTLTLEELEDIVKSNQNVVINCDFCGESYQHQSSDVSQIINQKIHPN